MTKTEKGAAIAIVIIALAVLTTSYLIEIVPNKPDYSKLHNASRILDSINAKKFSDNPLAVKSIGNEIPKGEFIKINDLNEDDWRKLNLDSALTHRLLNYKHAIGGFKNLTELKRVYGIDTNYLNGLNKMNHLQFQLDDQADSAIDNYKSPLKNDEHVAHQFPIIKTEEPSGHSFKVTEINSATVKTLEEIHGIGPVFSNRILKYRDLLGGFFSKEQLKEVYGIDSLKYTEIENQIRVDSMMIKRIDISNAEIETMAKHPYVSYQMARLIVNYRIQHGPFLNIDGLGNIYGISKDELEKATPYFKVDK